MKIYVLIQSDIFVTTYTLYVAQSIRKLCTLCKVWWYDVMQVKFDSHSRNIKGKVSIVCSIQNKLLCMFVVLSKYARNLIICCSEPMVAFKGIVVPIQWLAMTCFVISLCMISLEKKKFAPLIFYAVGDRGFPQNVWCKCSRFQFALSVSVSDRKCECLFH